MSCGIMLVSSQEESPAKIELTVSSFVISSPKIIEFSSFNPSNMLLLIMF